MKTLLILLATIGTSLAQTKDFQVMEIKRDGFIVQSLVSVIVKKGRSLTDNEKYAPSYYNDIGMLVPGSLAAVGGGGGTANTYKTVLEDKQYFVLRSSINEYFNKGYRFNGSYEFVKLYEKDGKQIEILKLIAHKPFINKNNKKKEVIFKMARKNDPVNTK